jgi:hypothetical protein
VAAFAQVALQLLAVIGMADGHEAAGPFGQWLAPQIGHTELGDEHVGVRSGRRDHAIRQLGHDP